MNYYLHIITTALLSLIITKSFAQEPKLVLPIEHTGVVIDAQFSPNNELLLTCSDDHTAKVWNGKTGVLLYTLEGHTEGLGSAKFSPDGEMIVTTSGDGTCRLWRTSTGKIVKIFTRKEEYVGYEEAAFIPSYPKIQSVLTWYGSDFLVYNISSGKMKFKHTQNIIGADGEEGFSLSGAAWSPDGKKILVYSDVGVASVLDAASGATQFVLDKKVTFRNASFSNDGKWIIACAMQHSFDEKDKLNWYNYRIWDAGTGKVVKTFPVGDGNIYSLQFSPDSKKFVACSDSFAILINTATWKPIDTFKNQFDLNTNMYKRVSFSPDLQGKWLLTAGSDSVGKIWEVATGKLVRTLEGLLDAEASIHFSPDGKKIVSSSNKNNGNVWDASTGKLLFTLKTPGKVQINAIHSVVVSPKDKWILSVMENGFINVWEKITGKLIQSFAGYDKFFMNEEGMLSWDNHPRFTQFSPDEKLIITYQNNDTAKLWNTATGKYICSFKKNGDKIEVAAGHKVQFGKKIFVITGKDTSVLDMAKLNLTDFSSKDVQQISELEFSGRLPLLEWKSADIKNYPSFYCPEGMCETPYLGEMYTASCHTGKWMVTVSNDNTIKIRDSISAKILYSFFSTDSTDYLIVDKDNRYDGTEAARKALYFTCGNEIVDLNQVKDLLWVPNLAYRINTVDPINNKTLAELKICGLIPLVEVIKTDSAEYRFSITPRRGGLGETVVNVNGIEAKRYKPEQLQKKQDGYELVISKQSLDSFFVAGTENPVTVIAYTSDNTITSRGFTIEADNTTQAKVSPNLYAVMIGVSDYKDDDLDLQYAAKDATDFSNALAVASRRLLNDSNGKEHVFTYNLTTETLRDRLPEKNSIKEVLREIGTKATANDVLFIFFAGHGVMQGNDAKKQFYFLTADASVSSATNAIASVGISMNELAEWIKPSNIKAQKRILIFDACNSGQAIRDFVQLGKTGQGYVAARSDEKGQQIKAIEKLNDQSGLFILAASATNQSAYEMGRYSQGLLTYSLLKAIKQQPEILENGKYLDVSNWLNAAKKTVSLLADESGARQEPQLNANNNFNIGLVDEEVRSKIILSDAKPLFAKSNFLNIDIITDNLKLGSAIDKQLVNISSASNAPVTFSAGYEGMDAYLLSGKYTVSGGAVSVTVVITKGVSEIHRFEIKGSTDDTLNIATTITAAVIGWLKSR